MTTPVIMESQTGLGWKGPFILPSPLDQVAPSLALNTSGIRLSTAHCPFLTTQQGIDFKDEVQGRGQLMRGQCLPTIPLRKVGYTALLCLEGIPHCHPHPLSKRTPSCCPGLVWRKLGEVVVCVCSAAPALGLGNTLGPGLVGSVGGMSRSLKEVPGL